MRCKNKTSLVLIPAFRLFTGFLTSRDTKPTWKPNFNLLLKICLNSFIERYHGTDNHRNRSLVDVRNVAKNVHMQPRIQACSAWCLSSDGQGLREAQYTVWAVSISGSGRNLGTFHGSLGRISDKFDWRKAWCESEFRPRLKLACFDRKREE